MGIMVYTQPVMIKNYLSVAFRNIRQSPLYAFINIFSLAIGLAACMAIYLFVSDELSFDGFHHKRHTLYRLDEVQSFPGTNQQRVALSMPGMGPHLLKDFPEIQNYARYYGREKQLLVRDDKRFLLPSLAAVDSTFLDMFDFPLLIGDPQTALDEPLTILLTEETALKFFSNKEEAMNKTVTWRNKELRITGILKNIPENSHLQFGGLVSMTFFTTDNPNFNNQWGSNWLNTYVQLHPNTDVPALEAKFPDFMSRHMDDPDINQYYKLFLQPLRDVHLASTNIEHDYNNYRKFNGRYLDVFYVVGVFILLIASVNFMNLTTARSSHRWKEIGVRTSVGAKKNQLFIQFIFESVMLAIFALVVALLLNLIFLPLLNTLIGRQLVLPVLFDQPLHVVGLVGGTLLLGVLTGIYPSFYMTSFSTASVLKSGGRSEGTSLFRSGLVIVQFGLAVAMIVSTLVVTEQLQYMKNADIGFNTDQILLIDMNRTANEKFETLREELKRYPVIKGVTASGQRLGNNFHQWGFKVKADTGVFHITPSNVIVDYDYLTVYGMQLLEGRDFSREFPTDDGKAFIINESLARELGLKEKTIGTQVGHGHYHNDSLGAIIGIVKDFNFNSLHYKINTLAMVIHKDWGFDEMSVKIEAGKTEEGIALVKKLWDEHVPDYPLDYTFLDEHFAQLYRSDQQMSAVVSIMAGLSILISCMGLFGLAAITTKKKTKEIGIRKVLGATEAQITLLLSRNFTVLILIAFTLVSPLTWYLLSNWLEGFAYRIGINPLLFIAGGLVALAIALLTISYHTVRSARANPVESLRYE